MKCVSTVLSSDVEASASLLARSSQDFVLLRPDEAVICVPK